MVGKQGQQSTDAPPPPSLRPTLAPLATSSPSPSQGLAPYSSRDTPSTIASSTLETPSSPASHLGHRSTPSLYSWQQHRSPLSAYLKSGDTADAGNADDRFLGLHPQAQRSGSEFSSGSWTGDDVFSESSVSRQSSCETDIDADQQSISETYNSEISMSPSKMSAPTTQISTVLPHHTTRLRRRAIEITPEELVKRLDASYGHELQTISKTDDSYGEQLAHQHLHHAGSNFRVQIANSPPPNFKSNDTASTVSTVVLDTAAPPTHAANNGATALNTEPLSSLTSQPSPPPDELASNLARLAINSANTLAKPFDTSSSVPPLIVDLRPVELFSGASQLASTESEPTGHVHSSVNLLIPGLILRRWAKSVSRDQPCPSLQSFITTPMSKRRFSDIVNAAIYAQPSVIPRSGRASAASPSSPTMATTKDNLSPSGRETNFYDHYWKSDIIVLCDDASSGVGKEAISASTTASTSSVLIETLERTPSAEQGQAHSDRGGGVYYLRSSMATIKSTLPPSLWSTETQEESTAATAPEPRSQSQRHDLIPNATLGRSKTISARPRSPDPASTSQVSGETKSTASAITSSSGQRPLLARLKTSELLGRQMSLSQAASPRKSPAGLKLQVNTGIPKRSATLSSFPSDGVSAPPPVPPSPATMQSLQSLCREQAQHPPSRATFGDMCLAPGARGTFTFSTQGQTSVDGEWDSTPKPAAPLDAQFEMSTILPEFLYLGPAVQTEADLAELEQKGVRRVLNVATEIEDVGPLNIGQRFDKYLKVPMLDSVEAVGVQDSIRDACNFLDDARLRSEPVYVHCKAGKSRSVTIVIAYLIHALRWPLNKAYAYVVERRSAISPNIGFVAELMKFEERELCLARSSGIVDPACEPRSAHPGQHHLGIADLEEASRSMPSLYKPPTPAVVLNEPSANETLVLCKSSPNLAKLAN